MDLAPICFEKLVYLEENTKYCNFRNLSMLIRRMTCLLPPEDLFRRRSITCFNAKKLLSLKLDLRARTGTFVADYTLLKCNPLEESHNTNFILHSPSKGSQKNNLKYINRLIKIQAVFH